MAGQAFPGWEFHPLDKPSFLGAPPTETKTEQCGSQKLKTVLRESLIALRCAMLKSPFCAAQSTKTSLQRPTPAAKIWAKDRRVLAAAAGATRNTKPVRSDKTVQVPSAAKVAKARGFPLRPGGSQHGARPCYPQRAKGAFKLARWGIIRLSSAQVSNL